MIHRPFVSVLVSLLVTGIVWMSPAPGAVHVVAAQTTDPEALIARYCVTCHNGQTKIAGLALETLSPAEAGRDAETWEKVVRKIRTGKMPPSGAPRPSRADLDALAASLEARLDAAAVPGGNLDGPALHRLNRTE